MQTNIINNNSSFTLYFISGAVAFIIYLLILMLIISTMFYMRKQVDINTYNYNIESEFIFPIDSTIELSQVLDSSPKESQQEKPEEIKENILKEPEPAQTPNENIEKNPVKPNLVDVFSFISSETVHNKRAIEEEKKRKAEEEKAQQEKLEREQRDKERAQVLQRQADVIKQSTQALRQTSQIFKDSVNQAMQIKITVEKAKISDIPNDRQKYDKWYDDIQKILLIEWRKNRFYLQTPTGATVRIKVDSSGKLSYMYMVKQSPFNEYNNAVIAFLHSMENKLFPVPPKDSIEFSININSTLRY